MMLLLQLLVLAVLANLGETLPPPLARQRICNSEPLLRSCTLRARSKEVDGVKDIEGNCVFYTRIKEYGDNRMAKRAVSVLKDMYNKGVDPSVTHYNAALWACEKSDLFTLVSKQAHHKIVIEYSFQLL